MEDERHFSGDKLTPAEEKLVKPKKTLDLGQVKPKKFELKRSISFVEITEYL